MSKCDGRGPSPSQFALLGLPLSAIFVNAPLRLPCFAANCPVLAVHVVSKVTHNLLSLSAVVGPGQLRQWLLLLLPMMEILVGGYKHALNVHRLLWQPENRGLLLVFVAVVSADCAVC